MKSNIFKKAHELTKNIIKKGDNYRATFRLCLSFVYSQIKKGVKKMVELKGSEKQIKWATDIRREINDTVNAMIKVVNANEDDEELKEDFNISANEFIKEINNKQDSKYFIERFKGFTDKNNNIVDKVLLLTKLKYDSSKEKFISDLDVNIHFCESLLFIENYN